jgi:hypothetical protein
MGVTIIKTELESFTSSVKDFYKKRSREQVDYFIYFLTIEKDNASIQATAIRDCFLILNLLPYSRISAYLAENCKSKDRFPPKFLRIKNGFQLHRNHRILLETNLNKKPLKVKVKKELHDLLINIKNPYENEFLIEAINCFEISAYRASIIMVWNLTIDHLYEFILSNKLLDFNTALSKNTDKRIKIVSVKTKDDFNEMPENKFIEFCRSGGIITNDIRKILEEKLGIRNTYAHPSNLKILESKAVEFIEDLIVNVVQKYKI